MSARLARTVEQYTTVGSVARFAATKVAYERRLGPPYLPPDPAVAGWARQLREDGIVVIANLLDAGTIAHMLAALPPVNEYVESPEGERSFFYPNAHRITALAPFFENSTVAQLARACVSAQSVPLRHTIGLKTVTGETGSFETFYHMDTWKRRFKAFLYLEDVADENAPMVYVKGSHRGFWRLPMESRIARQYRVDSTGFARSDSLYLGCYWPHEVRGLADAYGFDEVRCTGRAGTLVAFDGRGLHRATPLCRGRRLTLQSYWIHPGDHT